MLVKTILNKCHKFKSFVYDKVIFSETDAGAPCLHVTILPRKNGRPICSGCSQTAAGYDFIPGTRKFEFIPIWGFPIFFLYQMRRVQCFSCGIKVEKVPWAKGKNHLTKTYMQFLANWSKSLSWQEVANRFKTSWGKVFRSVEYIVTWGLENRSLEGVTAIGVDEILWRRGHKYLTLVYQINTECIRLLWVGKERTEESFSKFFDVLGEAKSCIEYVCSDMWKAYLKVIKDKVPHAIHILDRFHIVANINKAIDEVRASENRKMLADGYEPILKKSRWALLKNPENLLESQAVKLKELLKYNLKTVRAYLLKEQFQFFWDYTYPKWAGRFLDSWVNRVMRSKIEPLKKEARSIRKHRELILNWFRAQKQFSSGTVEGLNNKVKVTMRKSYGFREYRSIEVALYHSLGKLPEPKVTHSFW